MIISLRIWLLASALSLPLLPATARLVATPAPADPPVNSAKALPTTEPVEPTETPAPPTSTQAEPSKPEPIVPTVIDTDHAEMVTRDGQTHFILTGNVKVTGNNLIVQCDRMELFTTPEEEAEEKEKEPSGNPSPEFGRMEKIIATGNVHIEQEGREGQAGKVELFLIEGRIVMTESPVISDENGIVSGYKITFNQGEARAEVIAGEGQRVRIELPSLPDLGAGAEKRAVDNGKRSQ